MTYQVCIDIGGTFTDCLVSNSKGEIAIFKSPTTPGEFERGFIDVLHVAAEGYGLQPADFMKKIELVVHGSTVSTNALVERKTVKVGLVLTEGHQDILVLREGPRKGAFQWRLDYPDPYVPRHLTKTVAGRIDARGRELTPLSLDDVRKAAAEFRGLGVEAVAVGLLWSVVNPVHELAVRAILEQELPGIPITLSHEINPMPREYKRIIAAAIDASINPIVRTYIEKLKTALDEEDFEGELLLANCVGGMMPLADMIRKPIYSVMSGPTLAPMAALALSDEPDIIVGDMGGTTFDVSALRDHQIIVTPDSMIHNDSLGIPKVDVRSVGAGGGSIAFVDEGGLLRVGPRSAGARPGPACYGKGGTEPTVTDANVVLGIVDPDYFLGGKMKLERELAEAAVDKVAERLGVTREQAAYAIYTTSNHNMVAAIEEITVREGINPRDSFFVCGGGATAIHIAEMADILGLKRYMVPRFMAGLSAFGGLICDIRSEESAVLLTSDANFNVDGVNQALKRLRQAGDGFLAEAGVAAENRQFEFSFLGRYEYQSFEIEVPFESKNGTLSADDLPGLVEAFHKMHERIYSIRADNDVVEFTAWKLRAIGKRSGQDLWQKNTLAGQSGDIKPKARRGIYQQESGRVETVPVYEMAELGAGARLAGPCLVEAETFTAYLKNQHQGEIDRYGNLVVNII
ncbi:hydantoinase/oxoprolinase family protein [Mesorhizobium sp. YC-39]|uniref:hydantoinase/oxoprolinase family protein n=1 Tax=unclassified Mesorhizobium TaxID=325217 RepID=UPI0021E864DF|nr:MULTISPECIES: hydantoinase/oxoprolinase family protein [unclassified Mesorhizobium]MCV3210871.1 hydantoinase/oxoprolinase family protein [Mesorhizobium sp. YC-2]MCV3231105.1 hydantoinase/oxoprolinase family protein [Mesorhizobium sp. YC-39]